MVVTRRGLYRKGPWIKRCDRCDKSYLSYSYRSCICYRCDARMGKRGGIRMSQFSIIDALSTKKYKWWTAMELRDLLQLGNSTITNNLTKLRKYKMVEYKKDPNSRSILRPSFLYKFKEVNQSI